MSENYNEQNHKKKKKKKHGNNVPNGAERVEVVENFEETVEMPEKDFEETTVEPREPEEVHTEVKDVASPEAPEYPVEDGDSVRSNDEEPETNEEYDEDDESELEMKLKRSNRRNRIFLFTIIILLMLLGSCIAMYQRKKATCDNSCPAEEEEVIDFDPNQGQYASEEEIDEHIKQIAMPGWASFTIPANTTSISQGFEFHNPTGNSWYEDTITINGIETETIIVGENEVKIDHLLRIVGIKNTVKSIVSYDDSLFKVELGSDNQFFIKGLKGFDGTQEIVVETANGDRVTLSVTSKAQAYYMTFGLYIEGENGAEDELIYQSGLVEPGMYIQRMDLTRTLKRGTYKAYVLCQPYKSDAKTKTNNGIVEITLYVA